MLELKRDWYPLTVNGLFDLVVIYYWLTQMKTPCMDRSERMCLTYC